MDCPPSRRSPPLGEEEQQRHLSVKKISPPVHLEAQVLGLVGIGAVSSESRHVFDSSKPQQDWRRRPNSPIRRVLPQSNLSQPKECSILPQLGVAHLRCGGGI